MIKGNELVKCIRDKFKKLKNLRTLEKNINDMSQPRWWEKKQTACPHVQMQFAFREVVQHLIFVEKWSTSSNIRLSPLVQIRIKPWLRQHNSLQYKTLWMMVFVYHHLFIQRSVIVRAAWWHALINDKKCRYGWQLYIHYHLRNYGNWE